MPPINTRNPITPPADPPAEPACPHADSEPRAASQAMSCVQSLGPESARPFIEMLNLRGRSASSRLPTKSSVIARASGRVSISSSGSTPESGWLVTLRMLSRPVCFDVRPTRSIAAMTPGIFWIGRPWTCTLPRVVRSAIPWPDSYAMNAIVRAWSVVISQPGIRMRIM